MPGSRAYEVENLVPFYFAVALRMRRERPISRSPSRYRPSRRAIKFARQSKTADIRACSVAARRLVSANGLDYLTTLQGDVRIPVVRNALAAAVRARLVLTIPGTKTIELAVLGKPVIAITPLNAPEVVTINGPLTYLNRVPFIGNPLKRAVAVGLSRRFEYHTQPNMDAGAPLVREVHGTVTPGRIARVALDAYDDRAWLQAAGEALAGLYRDHVGAADRMAASLLELAA